MPFSLARLRADCACSAASSTRFSARATRPAPTWACGRYRCMAVELLLRARSKREPASSSLPTAEAQKPISHQFSASIALPPGCSIDSIRLFMQAGGFVLEHLKIPWSS